MDIFDMFFGGGKLTFILQAFWFGEYRFESPPWNSAWVSLGSLRLGRKQA